MKPVLPSRAGLSRRDFIHRSAQVGALVSVPSVVSSRLLGANAPSNRIRVGQIGCGRIAHGHDMPGVIASNLADYVAVCDFDSNRVREAQAYLEKTLRESSRPVPEVAGYGDYRELLERRDIDAVVISTPDHWHAQLALEAVNAGKDVYLQKPMTMTVAEGIALRDAVQAGTRILQVGSQQRSWTQFRQACELVRSGRVGRVTAVEIGLPIDPTAPDDPPQPVPANLNYNAWLGPTPQAYYTEQRVHPQSGYGRPGWLRNESFCLGMITGWGAHHFDTAHWGLNCELSGPSRVEGRATFPTNKIWNVHGEYHVELNYPNHVRMTVADTFPNGIRFIGDAGWIFVARDGQATASDPLQKTGNLKPLDASDPRLLNPEGLSVHLPVSDEHHRNWLECVKSRQTPLAPAWIAHRSNTACVVSWIAMKLGRPLDWDTAAERFKNDAEANAMLARPERAPYGIAALLKA